MIIYSYFSNPLTDFSYIIFPQHYKCLGNSLCSKLELKLMDCLEAYGARKGKEKCAELLYDFTECKFGHIQALRVQAMHNERMKQYRAGKIPKPFEEHPPLDSFFYM